jgi:hypothetical protein
VSSLVGMLLSRRGRGAGNRGQGGGCGWKRGEPGREEAKEGGVEADGLRSGAEEKQKQNPETGQRERGKENRRGQGGGNRAEECGADSGEEGVRGFRKGGAAHTTPAPTTARVEPASHPVASRAAKAGGSAAPAAATGARRQDGAALGLAPPWCSRPRSLRCQGPEGEAVTGTRSRGAGGLRGATHSPRRAPPLHGSASRPRPLPRLRPCHSLRLRPQDCPSPLPDPSPPPPPPPARLFSHWAHPFCATFPTEPAAVFQSPTPKGRHRPAPVPPCPTLPCVASSGKSSRSQIHILRDFQSLALTPESIDIPCGPAPPPCPLSSCPTSHNSWASHPPLETFPQVLLSRGLAC